MAPSLRKPAHVAQAIGAPTRSALDGVFERRQRLVLLAGPVEGLPAHARVGQDFVSFLWSDDNRLAMGTGVFYRNGPKGAAHQRFPTPFRSSIFLPPIFPPIQGIGKVAFDAGAKRSLLPMTGVGDTPSIPGELFATFPCPATASSAAKKRPVEGKGRHRADHKPVA